MAGRAGVLFAVFAMGATLFATPARGDGETAAGNLETVEVVGVTPRGRAGMSGDDIPANLQSATAQQIRDQLGLDITEFMSRNVASLFLNDAQNGTLQADVLFRGFVASPLLGLPQGLSVYQNGVRINEPFGDTVNWALIPDAAVAGFDLVPGSNPVFGRNSLGGAMVFRTKSGFSHPGYRAEFLAGSHARTVLQGEAGGVFGPDRSMSYYLSAWYFNEDGWRDFSPSETGRLFANVGWQRDRSSLDLDLTIADTDLIGNGPLPADLLALDRQAIFTHPDQTRNELLMLGLRGSHTATTAVAVDWNVFYRASDIASVNGDDSDFETCERPENAGFICAGSDEDSAGDDEPGEEEDEEILLDQFGSPIAADPLVEGATLNRTRTRQNSVGAAVQLTLRHAVAEASNQLVVGADVTFSDVAFDASTELGMLDETRRAVPGGVFAGDSFTDLKTDTRDLSVYFADSLSLSERLNLLISGRWSRTTVELQDQLGTALNGDHSFSRFNPAVGMTFGLSPVLTLYAGYAESNRVPSPVELTCADENDPCRLPNAFLADPPLRQVVSRTYEFGVRGRPGRVRWHAGGFHGTNLDDILFISAGSLTNQGFFDNVGETRRQGVEISVNASTAGDRASWFVNYTRLKAEFREPFTVSSANHPLAVGGEIAVVRGDRLPGIPRDLLKLGGDVQLTDRFSAAGELVYSSSRYLRGDEANLLAPVKGHAVLNIRGQYRFNDHVAVLLKIDNVLDERYETFGLLGDATEVLGEAFFDPRFLSPGAPRSAWIGLRIGRAVDASR